MSLPTREDALILLKKHVKDEYQLKHAQMVATAMEACADKFGEDKELWYVTGLLHDIDYFEYPEEHPNVSLKWFKEWRYPEDLIHAVEAHAFMLNNVEPKTKIAAALIACDELSGFLYAYSLMRPTGFDGMDFKGVKKRLKDKNFAAKINRDDIQYGVEKLGLDMKEHVELLINVFLNQ